MEESVECRHVSAIRFRRYTHLLISKICIELILLVRLFFSLTLRFVRIRVLLPMNSNAMHFEYLSLINFFGKKSMDETNKSPENLEQIMPHTWLRMYFVCVEFKTFCISLSISFASKCTILLIHTSGHYWIECPAHTLNTYVRIGHFEWIIC